MNRKTVSIILTAAMAAGMLAGCGSSSSSGTSSTTAATAAPAAASEAGTEAAGTADAAAAADEGKVLNIQCWNEEFKTRLIDHYPGYEEVDATHGKIGDVTVNWQITPTTDNAYQNNLDTVLPDNENASPDDRVDIFLMEADYALKYVNADPAVTETIASLGITDDELANQYQYTKDVVTDSDGNLRGLSWQACPGVLIYNRAAAKEVLGTDDPDQVQEYVKDWDSFDQTADKLKDAGYKITSSVADTYRVYSTNVSHPWVTNGVISIDDNIKKWVDDSMTLYQKGETDTFGLWSDDWSKGFYPDGKVFCYFGPAWLIDFSMAADTEGSIANQGGWGAVEGPQGFYWGGTWIAAAKGTDNPTLVADIMRKMTTDKDIMTDIVKKDNDFVNNKPVMEELAKDPSYGDKVLGGQNALNVFCAGADKVDLSNISDYDQGCNEAFQTAMGDYFSGNATYDECVQNFYKNVEIKYPELTNN